MDDTRTQRPPTGGDIEPLGPAGAGAATQASRKERFELRDPFAEVTHRSNSLEDMIRKAEGLHANRFTVIDDEGRRSMISKVAGAWRRSDPTPSARLEASTTPPNQVPARTPSPREPALDAERAGRVAALEAALAERYLIKRAPIRIGDVTIGQTEYRHRGDTSRIAFTESTARLSTETNNPSVARSMIDVAEARNWQALRVSGSDDFRRAVWLEASLRNVRTVGYEPLPADHEVLRKEGDARRLNRVEPLPTSPNSGTSTTTKQSARGGGQKTVLAALEAVLVAQKVPTKQREAVMAAATTTLAARTRAGETLRVKVFDRAATVHRPSPVPPRVVHRAREVIGPTR